MGPAELRPGSPEDQAAVGGLLRADEIAEHGRVTADWDEIVGFLWRTRGFVSAQDTRVVVVDGSTVGFVGVFPGEGPDEPDGAMSVLDPDVGEGTAALDVSMLEWAIGRSHARGTARLRFYVSRGNDERQALLRGRGFARVRTMWTMHRDLPAREAVGPPDGISIVTLAEHPDLEGVHAADQQAFAEHFGFVAESFEDWHERRIDVDGHDPEQWFLALDGDDVAGYVFQVTGGLVPQIAQLGVRPPWRGRGIGSALLHRSFADIARRGGHEVTLWVDSENATGAVGVYERAGMQTIAVTDEVETDLR